MNPAYQRVLVSMIQRVILAASVWLTAKGVFTPDEANSILSPTVEIVAGLAGSALVFVWGWLRAWWTQQVINTAAGSSPMSLAQVEAKIASGTAAPATTPKTEVPSVTKAA